MNTEHKQDFAMALGTIGIALGHNVEEQLITVYWQALNDLGFEDFKRAASVAIRTLKWFPKPAELREFAEGPSRITAAMQWAHVRRMVDKIDIYGSPDFGSLVNAILHALGGWKVLCEKSIPDLVWYQKDFERLHDEYAAKDLSTLRTEGHVGEFGRRPEWCALPGVPHPPKQLESAERHAVNGVVKGLADGKAVQSV